MFNIYLISSMNLFVPIPLGHGEQRRHVRVQRRHAAVQRAHARRATLH